MYFSIIAIPALSQALADLRAESCDVDMLCIQYSWFRSFMKQYKNIKGEELTNETFEKMNLYEESQRVMNTPVTKAIENIFDMTMMGV